MKTLPWLSLVLVGVVQAEWSSTCPDFCDCKWISGKKSAICSDQELRNIPRLSSEIQHLNLSGNPLRSLPKDAFSSIGLAHVQKLYLSSCSIKTVHRSAFDDLGNMIELDLSGNAIENLPPETFTGCIRLQMLYLSRNSLLKIGPGVAFPKLPRLRTLDLSFNKIKDISDKAFLNLQSSVITVNLRGNMLEDLLPEPFMGFKELKSLVLDHNPWRCYCYLRRLRDFVVQAKLITVEWYVVNAIPLTSQKTAVEEGLRVAAIGLVTQRTT
ncbi:unnamed protein product [Cyprideis torosa]|uniref:Uncharacterized protein n=1 Tax=Cyprideis torosa TaxID=163714 RepID=A0A7R8ZPN3_9CRUS|nr:unnamed protein product [Cyprideis torosa]CAG0890235.1 unnamed protein product [Cyprideis torosa]